MAELIEIDESDIMPRKRVREESELDITPMIDITFLLLIFFIVASKLDSDPVQNMPTAQYASHVAISESVVITMIEGGREGRAKVFKGDGLDDKMFVDDADIGVQEQEISDYVAMAFAGELPGGEPPKQFVLIKAAEDIRSGELNRVALAAARGGENVEVSTLFIGVKEDQ
ncbi:MAG: biopolymer transporter ExbD [Pirellulaceae bacterium]